MQGRISLRENEQRIISVTPVATGLFLPLLSFASSLVVVNFLVTHLQALASHELLLLLIFAGPCAGFVGARTWQWRSNKVHVTTQRVIAEGGITSRFSNSVELREISGATVEQSFIERLIRRGEVVLETPSGPFYSGLVNHPAALCRIIDGERATPSYGDLPLDTVFEPTYEVDRSFGIRPRKNFLPDDDWSQ